MSAHVRLSHDPTRHGPGRAPLALFVAALASSVAASASGQVATGGVDTTSVVADPRDVESVARAEQADFERRRIRHLPLTYEPFGGSCDEVVGRLCTTYGEGEWYPVPEDEVILGMRRALVVRLDSLQELVPASAWILGQRVWYRAEGGAWEDALRTARSCGEVEGWWCDALEGFALHGLGRYSEAHRVFERALAGMDPEVARAWRVPRWPVDADVRDRLGDAEGDEDRERRLLDLVWLLADPLYLVEGNDRLTEHYARHTVARLRDRARNPFRLSWGSDLEELTVRHGWEMGWERRPTRDFGSLDQIVGHKHPEGRDYMPPGAILTAPAEASAADLQADLHRPRSLYAPAYAPLLLPMEGQVAVFPRGTRTVVVATHFLPEDTTYHATHAHPLPWLEPGDQADDADRIGLFAVPVDGGRPTGVERSGSVDGALMLDLPTGAYVLSSESWSPALRRAGRFRVGVPERPAPEDIATLSDLLLLRPSHPGPNGLEAAVELALPMARIRAGQPFSLAWEIVGLGFRAEALSFEVSVTRTDRSFFQRVGRFLGLGDGSRPLTLAWEEPGPSQPGPVFRSLDLDVPSLDEGRYEIRLVLKTTGRSDAVTTSRFRVVPPR
jgi:tetratricopeptide (TPR) repeat protein